MLGRERKNGVSGQAGEGWARRQQKNNTIEASMLLKTQERICKTN